MKNSHLFSLPLAREARFPEYSLDVFFFEDCPLWVWCRSLDQRNLFGFFFGKMRLLMGSIEEGFCTGGRLVVEEDRVMEFGVELG